MPARIFQPFKKVFTPRTPDSGYDSLGVYPPLQSIVVVSSQFPIWSYANSTTMPGNLAVSMTGNVPTTVGEDVTISGASLAAYNGTWDVLDSTQISDPTHGLSTVLSLRVPWSAAASGGTLSIPLISASVGSGVTMPSAIYYAGVAICSATETVGTGVKLQSASYTAPPPPP